MIQIKSFINQLMSSNCYVVFDDETLRCFVVDPGSQYSEKEIEFIESEKLNLDYIILTHEHSDHTWGCNALIARYPHSKVVCSEACAEMLPIAGDSYFQFYLDDVNYHYKVERVDIILEKYDYKICWNEEIISFINTPGHSNCSVCFSIKNYLFTGDTLMKYKPYVSKKNGEKEKLKESIDKIFFLFDDNTRVCPGHGPCFNLSDFYR